jgi:hypothetical protein
LEVDVSSFRRFSVKKSQSDMLAARKFQMEGLSFEAAQPAYEGLSFVISLTVAVVAPALLADHRSAQNGTRDLRNRAFNLS